MTTTAIVCAWRAGEDDLTATIESAAESAGPGASVYSVEDKTAAGPGRTRDRGIEAATDSDVICIIDAHMRFKDGVIADMADRVRSEGGGLLVPYCSHNETCTYDAHPYSGARMVYRERDGKKHYTLPAKWSTDPDPGPRTAVMGACYVFNRAWYMDCGRPLAALVGWGGDEEALSMAAWFTGQPINLHDGHVAHLYRRGKPWNPIDGDRIKADLSRMALVYAFVHDRRDREELEEWTRQNVTGPLHYNPTPEAKRLQAAMMGQDRTWQQFKATVCEPEIMDGQQEGQPMAAKKPKAKKQGKRKTTTRTTTATKSANGRANYGSAENRRTCRRCDSTQSKVDGIRHCGNMIVRYRTCCKCGAKRTTTEVSSAE